MICLETCRKDFMSCRGRIESQSLTLHALGCRSSYSKKRKKKSQRLTQHFKHSGIVAFHLDSFDRQLVSVQASFFQFYSLGDAHGLLLLVWVSVQDALGKSVIMYESNLCQDVIADTVQS